MKRAMKRAVRSVAMGLAAVVLTSGASGQEERLTRSSYGVGGVRIGRPTFMGSSQGHSGVVRHYGGPVRGNASMQHGLGKVLGSDSRYNARYASGYYGDGYYGGSGLRGHGSYRDDRWRVSLHLGSGYTGYRGSYSNDWYYRSGSYIGCYPYPRYRVPYYGYRSYNPYYYGTTTYYGSAPIEYPGSASDPRVAIPRYEPAPPEPIEAEIAEPEEPLGKARWNLARKRSGEAIGAYRAHLDEHSDDAAAMRELAVALMEAGELADGVAVLRLAYDTDPAGLADEAIEPMDLLGYDGDRRLARVMRRMSIYANKTESASTWLAVGVLMQGQGRDRLALKMVVRAVAEGLDDAVAQPLTDALRRGGYAP